MYAKAAKVKKLHYFTKLNSAFCSDLHWWHTFISGWNGRSFLHLINNQDTVDCHIYTDASGSWGCGAFFTNKWFEYAWTADWLGINIMAKELVLIVISCAIWGQMLVQEIIEVH